MDGNNSIGDFIKAVFPSTVSRNDKVFKALLADTEESPGTMEKLLTEFQAERDDWGKNNVYDQTGEQLERTMEYYSVLKRMHEEKDDRFKFRNRCLFQRNGDQLWGDYWNILKLFRTYFNNEYLFIVNNTNRIDTNYLLNADFEAEDEAWEIAGGFSQTKDARFSGSYGLEILGNGYCRQEVTLEHENKTYFLHFFLKGTVKVSITNSSGKYWNGSKGEFGDWQDAAYYETYHTEDWDNKGFYFLPGTDLNVTISFEYANDYAFVDYVRLFEKPPYPTFTIISTLELEYTDDTASLAPYTNDPVSRPDYTKAGYGWQNEDDISPQEASKYERADYVDQSSINEDVSPVLLKGGEDRGADDLTHADFLTEEVPMTADAPYGNDDFKSIEYKKMSYWNQAFISGAGGARGISAYNELIDIVKAYGTVHFVELLSREAEL